MMILCDAFYCATTGIPREHSEDELGENFKVEFVMVNGQLTELTYETMPKKLRWLKNDPRKLPTKTAN